jgi:hypothetical protein
LHELPEKRGQTIALDSLAALNPPQIQAVAGSPVLHPSFIPHPLRPAAFQATIRLPNGKTHGFSGEEIVMKITFRKLAWGLGMALAFGVLAATASAECGTLARPRPGASLQPQAGQDQFQAGRLLLVNQSADPIVGMWHVKFTAWGNGADGPPDGTPIDNAIVQWHSDGTEIMNSGRPPQDGNFCLGVWEKVRGHYKINHFALGNDPNGNPAGPTHIRQDVVLSRNAMPMPERSAWTPLILQETRSCTS